MPRSQNELHQSSFSGARCLSEVSPTGEVMVFPWESLRRACRYLASSMLSMEVDVPVASRKWVSAVRRSDLLRRSTRRPHRHSGWRFRGQHGEAPRAAVVAGPRPGDHSGQPEQLPSVYPDVGRGCRERVGASAHRMPDPSCSARYAI